MAFSVEGSHIAADKAVKRRISNENLVVHVLHVEHRERIGKRVPKQPENRRWSQIDQQSPLVRCAALRSCQESAVIGKLLEDRPLSFHDSIWKSGASPA
jgi:hypothetical protein